MRERLSAAVVVLGMLPVLAAVPAAEQAQDRIERVKGVALSHVKVVEDTWRQVKAQHGLLTTSEPACNVRDVRYACEPKTYVDGRNFGAAGDYRLALKNLIYCLRNDINEQNAVLKQYLYYYIAYYYVKYAGEGAFEKARRYLDMLFKEIPDSRFLPDALILYADTYYHEGDHFQEALEAYQRAYDRLMQMAREVRGEHQVYLKGKANYARYRKAECMMLLGRHAEAKQEFQAVRGRTAAFPRVNLLASLGVARSLWQEKKYEEAFREFKATVERAEAAGVRDILAGAYAGLGDCYFEKKDYRRALWYYLKVMVQYFDAQEYVPKATYLAGRCWLKIAEEGKGGEGARAMARYYLQKAAAMKDSVWAEQAQKVLDNL